MFVHIKAKQLEIHTSIDFIEFYTNKIEFTIFVFMNIMVWIDEIDYACVFHRKERVLLIKNGKVIENKLK